MDDYVTKILLSQEVVFPHSYFIFTRYRKHKFDPHLRCKSIALLKPFSYEREGSISTSGIESTGRIDGTSNPFETFWQNVCSTFEWPCEPSIDVSHDFPPSKQWEGLFAPSLKDDRDLWSHPNAFVRSLAIRFEQAFIKT